MMAVSSAHEVGKFGSTVSGPPQRQKPVRVSSASRQTPSPDWARLEVDEQVDGAVPASAGVGR